MKSNYQIKNIAFFALNRQISTYNRSYTNTSALETVRLCKVIAIQWRNCINNCFNLFFQSGSKKYQNIVFLLIFRTRYVRWIFLNPSYTAPSGLILPGLAPGPPYKLGRSLSARLAGGESPLDSPKQARESRFPKPLRVA